MFDFLRARGEEYLAQISNELMANPRFIRAMQTAMRGKEWVDQAVAQALRTMNVPTRTEFKRAVARIDVLERELADAKRAASAAAAPRPRAAKAPTPKKKKRARPARKPSVRTPAE
jgi:hypothetical protein